MPLYRKFIILIIILDLLWAVMATVYDWNFFRIIPFYLWPFLIICPIYPFLLSIIWTQSLSGRINNYLFTFAVMPSIIYLVAAIIYYPTWMIYNGFDWLAFGSIFWVLLYGIQGAYLINKFKIKPIPTIATSLFLVISFAVQYLTNTYGAQDLISIPRYLLTIIYISLIMITVLVGIFFQHKKTTTDSINHKR